jgi:hypothetical protein
MPISLLILVSLMRTAVLILFTALLFSSCKKSDTFNNGNPVNRSYISTIQLISPGNTATDSFYYDSQQRMTRLVRYAPAGNLQGLAIVEFSYLGTSPRPASYTFYSDFRGTTDLHRLTFDGQGRIAEDTTSSGSGAVAFYTYSGNYIICTFLSDGTPDDIRVDTVTVTGGNITGIKTWHKAGEIWQQWNDLTLEQTVAANPSYKKEIAGTIGPLMYGLGAVYGPGGYSDFISRSVTGKTSLREHGFPVGSYTNTLEIDSAGRVISVTPTGDNAPKQKMVFTYY